VLCPTPFADRVLQFRHETYSLIFKRSTLLSHEPSQRLAKAENGEAGSYEERELCSEFPVLDNGLIVCPLLCPWLDDRVTEESDGALDGKEYEKAKEDVVEGFHF
jgi:hypothetical protein